MKMRELQKRAKPLLFLMILCLPLTACSEHQEPEQLCAVSAIGFDGAEKGIRVTVEIPVVSEAELGRAQTLRFTQTGDTVETALRSISLELSGTLIFSHCATVILGETLSTVQMQEIFAFAGSEEGLPLAAEVVICGDAEALLEASPLSAPAVGYEISEMLEQERRRSGAEMPCGIYELRSVASPNTPVAVPRFSWEREQETVRLRFAGLDILRPHGEAVSLSAEECVPYAILTDTYRGGSWGALHWQRVLPTWSVVSTETGLQIGLQLKPSSGAGSSEDAEAMEAALCQRTEALYARIRDTVGEDLFCLSERLSEQFDENGNTFFEGDWFAGSELVVSIGR